MQPSRIKFRQSNPSTAPARQPGWWGRLLSVFGKPQPDVAPKPRWPTKIVIARCQICAQALRSYPTVPCSNPTPHLIHVRCVELAKGKCPACGFAITKENEYVRS